MAIAQRQGLIAAAGPDVVILATTKAVRSAFSAPGSGSGNIKAFQPELKIPMTMRISQVAFTADESYLVLAAEEGGIAVYEVKSLLQGSTQSTFQMGTEGKALRVLAPNPTPEKAELIAVVTSCGKLLMANLKEKTFTQAANGQVLMTGVSHVSWSVRGKQLVAGLGDGSVCQMTPEGSTKDTIPKAPSVASDHYGKISHSVPHIIQADSYTLSVINTMAGEQCFHHCIYPKQLE